MNKILVSEWQCDHCGKTATSEQFVPEWVESVDDIPDDITVPLPDGWWSDEDKDYCDGCWGLLWEAWLAMVD